MATLEELQLVQQRNDEPLKAVKKTDAYRMDEGRIHWQGNAGGCQVGTVTLRVDNGGVMLHIPRIYGSKKLMDALMKLVKSPDCTLHKFRITQIDDVFIEFDHVDLLEAKQFAATGMMATIHNLSLMRFHEAGGVVIGPLPRDRRWESEGKRVIIQ